MYFRDMFFFGGGGGNSFADGRGVMYMEGMLWFWDNLRVNV